jgi:hypothetical protein
LLFHARYEESLISRHQPATATITYRSVGVTASSFRFITHQNATPREIEMMPMLDYNAPIQL